MSLNLPLFHPDPQWLIDAVAGDLVIRESLIQAALDGEVDSHNDMGLYRRRTHRGSRAEIQSLQYLGHALAPLGGEWEETTNQARFLFASRFGQPVRLIYCRGEMRDYRTFRIGHKGKRTRELINENLEPRLFNYTATTASTQEQALEELVYNLWFIADATETGMLSLYLGYATELRRVGNKLDELRRMDLTCEPMRLLRQCPLTDANVPLGDLPAAQAIEDPFLEELDLDVEDPEDDDEAETASL